ncbi:MAG: transposase family protein [Rikenellaceae bacterium]
MIIRNDIKIRHNDDDNVTVWLSERVVIEVCGVSDLYVRRLRSDYKKTLPISWCKAVENQEYFLGDTGKAWRYGFKDGGFWYDLDRIPNRAPVCYRSLLPNKQELINFMSEAGGNVMSRERWVQVKNEVEEKVEDLIEIDDVSYYKHYGSEITGKALAAKKALQLAESVAWVTFIKNSVEDGYYHTLGFKTIKEFYEWVALVIAERKLEGLKISTGRSLRNKIDLIAGDRTVIRKALVSAKYGNTNAAILGKKTSFVDTTTGEVRDMAVHETLILSYYMNFGNAGKGTKIDLYKKYQQAMGELDERPVSLSLFSKYLATNRIQELTALQRHGKEYFCKMVQTYVPSRKLEHANSLWCADASGTISYRYYTKKGDAKTRKLYTILVSDVASGYIVGHSLGKERVSSENYNTMREAVANAVSNPLNANCRVLEFLSDNHGAYTSNKAKEYLKMVAKRVRTIAPHNSQANPAERLFKVFKGSLRGLYNLFDTSFGSQSVENQANPDYFTLDSLPTYEEAKKQLDEIIYNFNNRTLADGTTPQERFVNTKNPQCGTYTEQDYRRITTTGHEVNITSARGIVSVMREGRKVRYELPIDAHSKALIAKYTKYSAKCEVMLYADGDSADMYDAEGIYMMTINRVDEACISTYEATDEEKRIRQHHEQRKLQQLQEVEDFEVDLLEDINTMRGGDRFALEMALNSYKSPKKAYNNTKEEAINSAVKAESKAIKAKQRADKTDVKDKELMHIELLKKSLKRNVKTV